MNSQASKQQNYTFCPKQQHSSLGATCEAPKATQMCQIRYVAVAIQKIYKHEEKDSTKEFHTERSTTANLDKNISFQGLGENLRFSLAVYALKHFESTQNIIYRKTNGMKIDRDLEKHKSYNFSVDCRG